jgi:hypothetical protein
LKDSWKPSDDRSLLDLLSCPLPPNGRELDDLVAYLAQRLDAYAREIASVPRTMAECLAFFEELGSSGPTSERNVEAWMQKALDGSPWILGTCVAFELQTFNATGDFAIYVYRPKGIVQRRMGFPEFYDPHYLQWDWYQIPRDAKRAEWVKTFFDFGGGDTWMVTHAAPIFHKRSFVGVATVDVANDEFNRIDKWLGEIGLDEKAYSFVSTSNLFVKPPPARSLQRPPENNRRLQMNDDYAELLSVVNSAKQGSAKVRDPLSGRDAVIAYAEVPSTGWRTAIVVPAVA